MIRMQKDICGYNERGSFLHYWTSFQILSGLLSISICGLYIYLNAFLSLIPWLLCLGGAYFLSVQFENRIPGFKMTRTVVLSYFILSIFGLIITLDNFNNFGTYFGYAGDDTRYFDKIALLSEGEFPEEYGIYEIVVSVFGRLLGVFYPVSFDLLDLLPFNWALASLCVGLSGQLAFEITGQRCKLPLWN